MEKKLSQNSHTARRLTQKTAIVPRSNKLVLEMDIVLLQSMNLH